MLSVATHDTVDVVGSNDHTVGTYDTVHASGGTGDTATGTGDIHDDAYDDHYDDYDDHYDDTFDDGGGGSSGRAAGAHTSINIVGQYDLSHGFITAAAAVDAAWNSANAAVAASTNPAIAPSVALRRRNLAVDNDNLEFRDRVGVAIGPHQRHSAGTIPGRHPTSVQALGGGPRH